MALQVNADLGKDVFVNSNEVEWRPSPLPGVDRRMLEREGDEVAVCATVVRYAPDSKFDAHTHAKGEEFIVMDGVFSDEHGDYRSGDYLRNPPGSSHSPYSKEGGTIFVRLRQFSDDDLVQKKVDTNDLDLYQLVRMESDEKEEVASAFFLPLHSHKGEVTSVLSLRKNTKLPARILTKVEEYFVLSGSCKELDTGRAYTKHCWARRPKGTVTQFETGDEECVILLREGRQLQPEA